MGGAVVANLTYDVQGNLASKGGQAYQFDLGNRLRSVPGQETGYEYDGYGRRVFAQTVGSGQVLSQYGNDGKLLYQNDARHGRRTDYVYLGNRLVAYRERPLSSSTATVKYQHVDALGTPIAVTNAAKATIETGEYEPYGRLVNKPLFDGPGYTGHVQDAATGLTYMQQRYYDPLLGVFLSVDPVTAYDSPMRQFNRYRYGNSNPYKYVDPDGAQAVDNAGRTAREACGSAPCQMVSPENGRYWASGSADAIMARATGASSISDYQTTDASDVAAAADVVSKTAGGLSALALATGQPAVAGVAALVAAGAAGIKAIVEPSEDAVVDVAIGLTGLRAAKAGADGVALTLTSYSAAKDGTEVIAGTVEEATSAVQERELRKVSD